MLASYARLKELEISTPEEFCKHPRIINLFRRQIDAATQALAQFETVKAFALIKDELTVDGGDLTPTLKVKRRVINTKYQELIDEIYRKAEKER